MALTISVDARMGLGGKAFRFISITHDETTTNFSANSVDLDYIEFVGQMGTYYPSDVASIAQHVCLTIFSSVGTNDSIGMQYPPKAGGKTRLMLIGW